MTLELDNNRNDLKQNIIEASLEKKMKQERKNFAQDIFLEFLKNVFFYYLLF